MAASAQTVSGNGTGTNNGFYYSLYSSGGSATMTLGSAGNYAINWSGVSDVVGGKGWNPGSAQAISYNVGSASGYNNISIYGWLTNPLVEYYITELGSLYTADATYKGSVSSDGHTYSTYEHQQVNQPSIQGTTTFEQYLDNWGGASTGTNYTVTTSNHFNHWSSLGMSVGSFNYQILGTEAYSGASGSVNATVWAGSSGGGGTCSPTAIVPYIYTASGGWVEESSVSVASGTAVNLGPQPETGGSWSWTGPNGFSSTSREIDGIALSAGSNVYTATYTNSCGDKSTQAFTITVASAGSFTLKASSSTLSVAQGASGTDTISVTDVSGFSGSVTLAASGLPSGVTAVFGTNPAPSSSVLTLTASSSAATGTSTVTVTGTSGSLSATTTISLTVTASTSCTPTAIVPYIYTASGGWVEESSISVSLGTAVDLGPQPETGGSWSWTGPNGFTSTSREIDRIALSAGSNVYTATYTNSCGSKSTQAFTITVSSSSSPSFTIAPSAASVTLTQGKTATDSINVTDVDGFTGTVTFATSILPSGVTATWGSAGALTLTATSTAAVGTSTITITGTSGSLTETTTISLTVAAASSGGSSCTVDYTISPQTSSAFGATVTIVNNGTTALSNWSLTWSFANGQTIASSWNGTVSQSGANVTVTEQSGQTWENIPAGGNYSGFGFNGTWNGTTNAIPTAFSLNGTACTVN